MPIQSSRNPATRSLESDVPRPSGPVKYPAEELPRSIPGEPVDNRRTHGSGFFLGQGLNPETCDREAVFGSQAPSGDLVPSLGLESRKYQPRRYA